jgi:hypothetical protein
MALASLDNPDAEARHSLCLICAVGAFGDKRQPE